MIFVSENPGLVRIIKLPNVFVYALILNKANPIERAIQKFKLNYN